MIHSGAFRHYRVLDAARLVPQHRERIYIAGFRESLAFEFPQIPDLNPRPGDILQEVVDPCHTLSDHLWSYLQRYAVKHRQRGNGFGFEPVTPDCIARTLSARYYRDGSEILVHQPGRNPRRLPPGECARLMGFPESFRIVVRDAVAYRLSGNSVAVTLVEYLAKAIVNTLRHPRITSAPPRQLTLF